MFSELTRIRPACARRPEVAMLIERAKSLPSSAMLSSRLRDHALALANRGLQEMQALAVERGRRRVIHLVRGNLQHLVFEIDGIAGGPRLEAAPAAVVVKTVGGAGGRDVAGAGPQHRQRSQSAAAGRALGVEFRLDQVARAEVRCVGV